MTAGLSTTAVPSTVHCDHLILAKVGARIDMGVAIESNKEVYDFLRTVSAKYGIGQIAGCNTSGFHLLCVNLFKTGCASRGLSDCLFY